MLKKENPSGFYVDPFFQLCIHDCCRYNKSHKSDTIYGLLLFGAASETRTRDPQLGKLMLYQLSYFRIYPIQRRCKGKRSFFIFKNKNVLLQPQK